MKSAVRSLPAPEYSEEELDKIFQYFMTLKSDLIREFLSGKELQKSGTKSDLAELISKYLQDGDITYSDLVNYLDTVTPYMKQHIQYSMVLNHGYKIAGEIPRKFPTC